MTPPLLVVEGSTEAVDRAALELQHRGWSIVDGWSTPIRRGGDVVRRGELQDRADAEAALLAALDGVGLLVDARGERDLIDRFVDDLRRLGPVDHRVGPVKPEPAMAPEARAILALLAEGLTLGEAADELGLSRRTADRRLSDARAALGAQRTTEAIARARRLGWFDPSGRH